MSATLTKLASLSELSTCKLMRVQHTGHDICLAFVDGVVYAVDNMCSHEDASLAKGSLHDDCVKCPLHGSCFNLKTGEALDEPAEEPINTYPVKIDGDDILVDVNEQLLT